MIRFFKKNINFFEDTEYSKEGDWYQKYQNLVKLMIFNYFYNFLEIRNRKNLDPNIIIGGGTPYLFFDKIAKTTP